MRKRIGFRLLGMVASGCVCYIILFCMVYFGMAREGFFLSAIDIPRMEAKWDMQEEDIRTSLEQMLTYVKSWDESISPQFEVMSRGALTGFYTDREIAHMRDVQKLIKGFTIAAIVAGVVGTASIMMLFVKKQIKEMAYGYCYVCAILIVLLGMIGVMSLIDLQGVINAFHKLLFEANTWKLNPAKHKVVWFFGKAVYRKAIHYVIVSAVIFLVALAGALGYVFRDRKVGKN